MTEKIKRIIRTAMNGASDTMSLNPNTNYREALPRDAASMMNKTWADMGERMQKAACKVGREIGIKG